MGEIARVPLTVLRLPGGEEMHKDAVERRQAKPLPPSEEEAQKCPRCDSLNTKFCYYNNYNLSQPRHFCKSCRRYWTVGGALRNIPVGGGSRKNSRRAKSKPNASQEIKQPTPLQAMSMETVGESEFLKSGAIVPYDDDPDRLLDVTGTFSSLLASNGCFGDAVGFLGWPSELMSIRPLGIEDFGDEKAICRLPESGEGSTCHAVGFEPIKTEYQGSGGWSDFTISSAGKNFR